MMTPAASATLARLLDRFDLERSLVRKDHGHGVGHSSMALAELLLQRRADGDVAKASAIIESVLAAQIRSDGPDYGRFPMLVPETWCDLNGTLFLLAPMVAIIEEHSGQLADALVERLQHSLRLAAAIVERRWEDEVFDVHRDFVAYSNIFALYVQSLLLLARHFSDDRLRKVGIGQWRRFFHHCSYMGIDEFVSPNYNQVVFNALRRMRPAAPTEEIGLEMDLLLKELLAVQYGLHHPLLGLPISGVSRDYRLFLDPGKGAMPAISSGEADDLADPSVLAAYQQRRFPYSASGRAGSVPFRFQSWQMPTAGLGSMTGGHYFPQQLHVIAAVGTSAMERAVAFLNADASNGVNGWVAQSDHRALCLFGRTTMSLFHTQLRESPTSLPTKRGKPPSLGLSSAWSVEETDEALIFQAYGQRVTLHGFALVQDSVQPRRWVAERATIAGHADVQVFRAAPEDTFAGCMIEVGEAKSPRTSSPILHLTREGRTLELRESGGLLISLTEMPTGEYVETYPDDSRTLPLFHSDAHTWWPGAISRASARPV